MTYIITRQLTAAIAIELFNKPRYDISFVII